MVDLIEEFIYTHSDKPIIVNKIKDPGGENIMYQASYYDNNIKRGIEFVNKFDDTLTPDKLKDDLSKIGALRKS